MFSHIQTHTHTKPCIKQKKNCFPTRHTAVMNYLRGRNNKQVRKRVALKAEKSFYAAATRINSRGQEMSSGNFYDDKNVPLKARNENVFDVRTVF